MNVMAIAGKSRAVFCFCFLVMTVACHVKVPQYTILWHCYVYYNFAPGFGIVGQTLWEAWKEHA